MREGLLARLNCALVDDHCYCRRRIGTDCRIAGRCHRKGVRAGGRSRISTSTATAAPASASASRNAADGKQQCDHPARCPPPTPARRDAEENKERKDRRSSRLCPAVDMRFCQRGRSGCRSLPGCRSSSGCARSSQGNRGTCHGAGRRIRSADWRTGQRAGETDRSGVTVCTCDCDGGSSGTALRDGRRVSRCYCEANLRDSNVFASCCRRIRSVPAIEGRECVGAGRENTGGDGNA